MRTTIVSKLIKKEITDILRDKKTLFAMILLPILLYPILIVAMTFLTQMMTNDLNEQTTNIVLTGDVPPEFHEFIDLNQIENVAFLQEEPMAGADSFLYTLHFIDDTTLEVTYNSTAGVQSFSSGQFSAYLMDYSDYLFNEYLIENHLDYTPLSSENINFINTASDTEHAGSLLGQILPMLLIMGVVLGAVYPAIDIVTGEKERGTLETLFTLPITSLELIASKFITVSICAIVSTLLNLISIGFSMAYFIGSMVAGSDVAIFTDFDLSQMLLPIAITVLCLIIFALFVSCVTMSVVSLAKTYKEAQNYITPLMIVFIFPSYINMLPTMALSSGTSVIPIINISLLLKSVFAFEVNITLMALVVFSNLIYCFIGLLILGRIFNSEDVLFGNEKNFTLLENRKFIQKGNLPGIADGAALYCISIMLFLYTSLIIISFVSNVAIITFLTQLIIVFTPICYAVYIKCNLKVVFRLNAFRLRYLFIGILLTAIALIVSIAVQQIMIGLLPSLAELAETLSASISTSGGLWTQLFAFALMPAICEELFFRGFLLTSFNVDKHPKRAILLTAVLFGVFHMNLLQFITGLLIGSVFAFVTYKSKSIYPAMILHFMNNAFAVMLPYFFQ